VGPDAAAWVTEGGQNAIARVDPATRAVKLFPPPKERRDANLNTATFDRRGVLWFTGQNGVYGRLDPKSGTGICRETGRNPTLVDDTDAVWVSDWGANAILRFDPKTEKFEALPLRDSYASVREFAGRKGEVWGAESAADKLFMIKSE
jgi:virginiamycin B lyase